MPAKIKVTGEVLKIRQYKPNKQTLWHLLEMREGGSPNSPKGLPPASKIHYTIIMNDRQLRRLNADLDELGLKLKGARLFVEGEITLDQPLDIVEGEIGVIAFMVQSIDMIRIRAEQQRQAADAEAE